MNAESNKGLSTVPIWDGKTTTAAMYIAKLEAMMEYHDSGDAMDRVVMATCPTKSEYDRYVGSTDANEKKLAKLYQMNKRACAIMVIGQKTNHGLAMIEKTKSVDYPHGLAWEAIQTMKRKNKPKDMSAEIEMEAELNKIQFRNAIDYYNDIVNVTSNYEVGKTDTELIKIMSTKVNSTMFTSMILKHMEDITVVDDLEELCTEIGKIQRLAKSTGRADRNEGGGKETQLSSAEGGGTFKGICGRCKTVCGYKRKDCPKKKAGGGNGGSGGGSGGGNSKYCNHCKTKGHDEDGCWKLHPDKAPQWYKDLKDKSGGETAGNSVEMMLAQVEDSGAQDFGRACL